MDDFQWANDPRTVALADELRASRDSLREQVRTLTAERDEARGDLAKAKHALEGYAKSWEGAENEATALHARVAELEDAAEAVKAEFDRGEWVSAGFANEMKQRVDKAEAERDAAQQRAQARSDVLAMLVRRHDEWDDADCWCEHKRSGPHALHGKACRDARATMGITTEAP